MVGTDQQMCFWLNVMMYVSVEFVVVIVSGGVSGRD